MQNTNINEWGIQIYNCTVLSSVKAYCILQVRSFLLEKWVYHNTIQLCLKYFRVMILWCSDERNYSTVPACSEMTGLSCISETNIRIILLYDHRKLSDRKLGVLILEQLANNKTIMNNYKMISICASMVTDGLFSKFGKQYLWIHQIQSVSHNVTIKMWCTTMHHMSFYLFL